MGPDGWLDGQMDRQTTHTRPITRFTTGIGPVVNNNFETQQPSVTLKIEAGHKKLSRSCPW